MMPMPAYRPTVASRKTMPMAPRDKPICSAMASTITKARKPPVYQP
jgi:hypothetical protein